MAASLPRSGRFAAAALALALFGGAALVGAGARAEEGVAWSQLTPAQRTALKPLERQWPQIEASRKLKWLDIAGRFPSMPQAEQDRVQQRMAEWAAMSPSERRDARMNYQAAKQVPAEDRQARWQAYQALPAEQRRELAKTVPPAPERPAAARRAVPADAPQAKSNIVPDPTHSAPPRAVAPTIVQAQPGATTSLMSSKPVPPVHQQPGLPKIAGPGFVDQTTLQPKRGPQGAAVRSAAASDANGTTRR